MVPSSTTIFTTKNSQVSTSSNIQHVRGGHFSGVELGRNGWGRGNQILRKILRKIIDSPIHYGKKLLNLIAHVRTHHATIGGWAPQKTI